MAVVRRTKDGIDILEHAMKGVRNSESREKIRRFHAEGAIVGLSSDSEVHSAEDIVEREVIVRLPDRRRSR